MLKGIDPLLNADILHALASMGHGDTLVICDANFPAAAIAAQTVVGEPLQMGVDALTALGAVLSVFPVDTFDLERPPVQGMAVVGKPDDVPAVVAEAEPQVKAAGSTTVLVERFAFYEAAAHAFVVLRTLETRPYGNFILRKGVIN